MARIDLVETSLRDGNQSLWGATGLTTPMMLSAAPIMDRVGFKAIDFTTSTHMAVAARLWSVFSCAVWSEFSRSSRAPNLTPARNINPPTLALTRGLSSTPPAATAT